MVAIPLRINGKSLQVEAAPVERLSAVLRDRLDLTGTKVGCDAGDCGACTVLLDGEPICSCLVAAGQAAECELTTVEGLGEDELSGRLQRSFLHFGAAQCGICTPGMLTSAYALLKRSPQPDRREVEDALGGVLCRCTGYRRIVDAVINAAQPLPDSPRPSAGENVGCSVRHLDGAGKVTGEFGYGADEVPEAALTARVIRSPHHHAEFTIGDKAAFLAGHDGLHTVLDASDIPGRNCFGVIPPYADQPVFAERVARYRGEAIACIVGEAEAVHAFDETLFPVEWRPLAECLASSEALRPETPRLHENRENNILIEGFVARGDAVAGLDSAAHKVTVTCTTPFIEHAYIEPEAGHARYDAGRVAVYGCTQAPQMDRESLAEILALDASDVRVVPSACGGGFGAKLDLSFQPYVALAAMVLKRPVVICYSRSESMRSTTKRHPSEMTLQVGCDTQGRISGFDFKGVFNTGAYASWGPTVANRVPVHASGPYFISDYRARGTAVHTNGPPAGAFRGFGVPQAAIAQECAYDELAEAAGIDPLDFRLMNALRDGQPTVTGQVFERGVGITACLEVLKPRWHEVRGKVREFNANSSVLRKGVGLASCWYGCGNTSLSNPSTIRMGITRAGQVVLHQGAVDIGQGANTVITQIAADALGVPVHSISIVGADTDLTPDCGKTSASRQTYITGSAAKLAGEALRATLLRQVNVGADASIELADGAVTVHDGAASATIELGMLEENEFGYVFMAEETYDPPTKPLDENGQGIPYAVYGYGAQIVELTVDTALGTVTVDHITAAHDVGKAVNPLLVEGQIEGGVAQGIGLALMEDYVPGVTENLHDYLVPTIGDMPTFDNIIVEVEDAEGPYGAKGLGEHVLIPTAPAILNAIRNATGARIRNLPATPDKVRAAILEVRPDG